MDYWALMSLAGEYAYAGREWVARKVVEILGGRELELVHNHHNFAWREEHGGQPLIVVRKGATPAFPGQKGFIGGSMGDDAVIVQGATAPGTPIEDLQRDAMFSTVHGAGRVMSPTAAAVPTRARTYIGARRRSSMRACVASRSRLFSRSCPSLCLLRARPFDSLRSLRAGRLRGP